MLSQVYVCEALSYLHRRAHALDYILVPTLLHDDGSLTTTLNHFAIT